MAVNAELVTTRLMLVRHAPAIHGGRLAGRRDVPADLSDRAALGWLWSRIRATLPDRVLVSPARRCLWTACALFITENTETDPRLWEQDFGQWEGLPLAALPDLGPLSGAALAAHRPPGGESFAEMAARARPVFDSATGTTLIIAHAGIVRAALALAIGPGAALRFAVAPLSLTVLTRTGPDWSVQSVNETRTGTAA